MRISQIIILLIFSIEFNILLYNSVGVSFVTIPAWVAFGAITTAVKLKLILVKIMFALRTMGIGSIRIKRSVNSNDDNITLIPYEILDSEELVTVWKELESTIGRQIKFSMEKCIQGVTTGNSVTISQKSLNWRHIGDISIKRSMTDKDASEGDGFSLFVSSVIGSMTKTVTACHILNEALQQLNANSQK